MDLSTYHKKRMSDVFFITKRKYVAVENESKTRNMLPIFARDIVSTTSTVVGAKDYICASYDSMWSMRFKVNQYNGDYKKMFECLNFYEIILEDLPCHLYIDSEVYINKNPDVDIIALQSKFKDELITFMVDIEHVASSRSCINVKILDSSNEKKISMHYLFKIMHCDNDGNITNQVSHMFKNDYHCGEFMYKFEQYLIQKHGNHEKNPFFIKPEKETNSNGNIVPIFDTGVYTKNRLFRMYGCSKHGSFRPLIPRFDSNQLYLNGTIQLSKQEWLDNLVQFVDPQNGDIKLIHVTDSVTNGEPTSKGFRSIMSHHIANQKRGLTVNKRSIDDISTNTNDDFSGFSMSSINSNKNDPQFKNKTIKVPQLLLNDPCIPMIMKEIRHRWNDPNMKLLPMSTNQDYSIMMFSSSSQACFMKAHNENNLNVTHRPGGNHIFFVVNMFEMSFKQMCYSKKEPCFNIKTNTKRSSQSFIFCNDETNDAIIKCMDKLTGDKKKNERNTMCTSILFKLIQSQYDEMISSQNEDE
jgi:hypothetical protein